MFLLRERVRQVDAAIRTIADELDDNAVLVERVETGHGAPSWLYGRLLFSAYEEQRATAYAYRKRHPQLWQDVIDVYSELRETHAIGRMPPASVAMRALAQSLREKAY